MSPARAASCDQFARLGGSLGDRLLDQHVGAACQEVARDAEVPRRRGDHADRIDLAQQPVVVREPPRAQFLRHRIAGLGPRIHHRHKLAAGRLRVLLRVEAPQVPDPDDGNSDFWHEEAIMPARAARPEVLRVRDDYVDSAS